MRILDKVPKHIDEIARQANMPVRHAAAILLGLELKGLVSQMPGKHSISGSRKLSSAFRNGTPPGLLK